MARVTEWRAPLSAAARAQLPAEVAQRWIDLFRPAVRLVPQGDGPPVGQLGGNPSLPADVAWPEWGEAGPLSFVATVDCAALPREGLDVALPDRGSLLFFYFDGRFEIEDDPFVEPGDPSMPESARVVYVPAGVPVRERVAPEGLRAYPRLELTAEVMATAPVEYHYLLDEVRLSDGRSLAQAAEDLGEVDMPGAESLSDVVDRADPDRSRHRIGGFGEPVQGPVEQEVALLVLGDSAEDARLREEAARWVLLAQIDSQRFDAGDDEMMWGDAGSLYWLIRRDDLAAGRFEAARFTVQYG